MIRKPDQSIYRESTAVTALRGVRTVAVQGAHGVKRGTRTLARWYLIFMVGAGILLAAAPNPGTIVLLIIGATVFGGWKLAGRDRYGPGTADDALDEPQVQAQPAPHARTTGFSPAERAYLATGPSVEQHIDLSVAAHLRAAGALLVMALGLFYIGRLGTPSIGVLLCASAMSTLAYLLVARLFMGRTVLKFDAHSVTVKGLFGNEGQILWADVEDIAARTYPLYHLPAIFALGGRRCLVIAARHNRLDGPTELRVPLDLLGLDHAALTALVKALIIRRAGGEDAADAVPPPEFVQTKADPNAEFDPDAIMARYMAERDYLIATQRTDQLAARPVFGRKVT